MRNLSMALFGVCLSLLMTMAASTAPWQSQGNFTTESIAFINATIKPIIDGYQSSSSFSAGDEATKNISLILNGAWDKAWNVIIMGNFSSNQIVLYGFAFRGHWLWWNSYTTKTSIIIWKDYHCQDNGWTTIGFSSYRLATNVKMTADTKLAQITTNFPTIFDDPWLLGRKLVTQLETTYKDQAFTTIVSNDNTDFRGYVCIVNNADGPQINLHSPWNSAGTKQARLLVMRML